MKIIQTIKTGNARKPITSKAVKVKTSLKAGGWGPLNHNRRLLTTT